MVSDMGFEDSREFDEWAENYDEAVRSEHEFPFIGYRRVLDRVVELAGVSPPCRILDLGIGTGNLAERFLDNGCRVWGIDFSSRMLDIARVKVPTAQLAQASILDPWPEHFRGRFDLLVSAYVFHHFVLPEKIEMLTRFAREHCEIGGRIVLADLSFPTRDALDQARVRWSKVWDEEHYWVAEEAIPACERAGLHVQYEQVVECAGVFVFETSAMP